LHLIFLAFWPVGRASCVGRQTLSAYLSLQISLSVVGSSWHSRARSWLAQVLCGIMHRACAQARWYCDQGGARRGFPGEAPACAHVRRRAFAGLAWGAAGCVQPGPPARTEFHPRFGCIPRPPWSGGETRSAHVGASLGYPPKMRVFWGGTRTRTGYAYAYAPWRL
jgi:hypothetical protein